MSALESVPRDGRLFELVVATRPRPSERATAAAASASSAAARRGPVRSVRAGAYRRRGTARNAIEDCAAVGAVGSGNAIVQRLDARDWATREWAGPGSAANEVGGHRVVARRVSHRVVACRVRIASLN